MTGHRTYKGLASLAALLVLVPLLTYSLALKRTLRLALQYGQQRQSVLALSADDPAADLPADSGMTDTGNNATVESVLAAVQGPDCRIESFAPTITRKEQGMTLYTARLSLGGEFAPLVRTVERIERQIPTAKIISADLRTVVLRSGTSRKKRLQLTLLIQYLSES